MKKNHLLTHQCKVKSLLVLSVILSSLFISSCNKYEEGPAISLRTKTERVHNNWKIAQALKDGQDVTQSYYKYELDLSKDGGATLSTNYDFAGLNYQFVTSGEWVFVSNKEKLSFDFDKNSEDGVYTILKLKEDEMWLRQDANNLELHYVTR
jgi:hypothetical protein